MPSPGATCAILAIRCCSTIRRRLTHSGIGSRRFAGRWMRTRSTAKPSSPCCRRSAVSRTHGLAPTLAPRLVARLARERFETWRGCCCGGTSRRTDALATLPWCGRPSAYSSLADRRSTRPRAIVSAAGRSASRPTGRRLLAEPSRRCDSASPITSLACRPGGRRTSATFDELGRLDRTATRRDALGRVVMASARSMLRRPASEYPSWVFSDNFPRALVRGLAS